MSFDNLFQKAVELQNAGALQQAEDIYLKILQVMPENPDVWNLLGLLAQTKGNLVYARDCFLRAIKYAPTPFYMHFFNLGLAYKSLNKNKEAIDALEKCVALKNDFAYGWQYIGLLQADDGHVDDALRSFKQAVETDENFTDARADLYFFNQEYDKLFELAEQTTDNFEVQYRAALATDNLTQKELYLHQAVQCAPERTEPLLLLARLKQQQNQNSEALTLYFKALNLDDKNVEILLGIADIYLAEKKFTDAEKFYKKSFDLTRNIAGAHINYGTLLYQQKRLAEALEEYRTAVALAPKKSEISYNLALILKDTGDIEEALGLMFNAHLKEPENETYALGIMETLIELAQSDKNTAQKIAENWIKNAPNNIFARKIRNILNEKCDESDDMPYAERLFDIFAETYDDTLQKLNPQIIDKFLELYAPLKGKILDLGCGTGMAAEKLKNEDNQFIGVDISEKMLAEAKKKNLYKELHKSDVLSFLENENLLAYDFILAFDVLCYVGNLYPIFEVINKGKIAFSVELAESDEKTDYCLGISGRYKHKKSYILKMLDKLGFVVMQICDLVLRQENGKDVMGLLVIAERV